MTKPNDTLKQYWRSLNDRKSKPKLAVLGQGGVSQEFPPGADELVISSGTSRRKFMGILGASTALAGIEGCGYVRKPRENILPFDKRPEDLVPGDPIMYATALQIGGTVLGVLVENQDGRPTKIEGNPNHISSGGATDVWAQATILDLYDPERSRTPRSTISVMSADAVEGEDEAALKGLLSAETCEATYERVLARTNSVDAAVKERSACEARVQDSGRYDFATPQSATLWVEAEAQIDADWGSTYQALDELVKGVASTGGEGFGLVVSHSMSPSFTAKLREFTARMPKARTYVCDPTAPVNSLLTAEALAGGGARVSYHLSRVRRVLSLDSDFLGTETDHVRLSREFAMTRRLTSPDDGPNMSRLYAVEPNMSITGGSADHRLSMRGSQVADFAALVAVLLMNEFKLKPSPSAIPLVKTLKAPKLTAEAERFAAVVAKDLSSAGKSRAVVIPGERQDPATHAIALLINDLLGSLGQSVGTLPASLHYSTTNYAARTVASLATDLRGGAIKHLVCIGANPVYEAPGSLKMVEALDKLETLVHAGYRNDETGQRATWHIPLSHELEAWGDLESNEGVVSICQPQIEPMFDTPSALELLARLIKPGEVANGMTLVRNHWESMVARTRRPLTEKVWRRWLHDGIATGVPRDGRPAQRSGYGVLATLASVRAAPVDKGIEVGFCLDYSTYGGRFANNGWMQELPDPTSKLVWDNAVIIGPQLATSLGASDGDMLTVKVGDTAIMVPCWIVPGQARNCVTLSLGQGRKGIGTVADGAGFDAYQLIDAKSPAFVAGEVSLGAGSKQLVSTQDWGSLDPDGADGNAVLGINYEPRTIYRETDVEGFKKDPSFAQKGDLMPKTRLESLWDHPNLESRNQWGMSIDLNACTGCNTCTIACQAENNIPVVGKELCANGREMHWIRLDRYYTGTDENNPQVVFQPVGCQHCESAPCETVCPVAATVHSPDGMNDMVYNRCIGTRYCANNCPYKVRRFNYFNFNLDIDPLAQMQKNPDVTVRFRGVMEKCSYCVQRISQARIDAHVAGTNEIKEGAVVTACQQACPSSAITFGDIANPESAVSKQKQLTRSYTLLADLNTLPRTSYLGRVRNPNPDLKDA